MIELLQKFIRPLKNRVLSMVGKANVVSTDDSAGLQIVKLEGMKGEVLDKIERVQNFGFTSRPDSAGGQEAIIVSVGGDRGNSIIVALDDSGKRLKNLEPGESAVYNAFGDTIILKKNGVMEVSASNKINITATAEVNIEAASVKVKSTTAQIDSTIIKLGGDSLTPIDGVMTGKSLGQITGVPFPTHSLTVMAKI